MSPFNSQVLYIFFIYKLGLLTGFATLQLTFNWLDMVMNSVILATWKDDKVQASLGNLARIQGHPQLHIQLKASQDYFLFCWLFYLQQSFSVALTVPKLPL